MRVHLAALETSLYPENRKPEILKDTYVLTSYYYARGKDVSDIIRNAKKPIIIDSGAFSFLGKNAVKGRNIDWDRYADEYADFLANNEIECFIELDIDNIVGYPKVKQLTRKIEGRVGRQCIPVWHKSRGGAEWVRLTKEYPYVAIGGIVSKEISPTQYPILAVMIEEAHKNGAKVHGLGFTGTEYLRKYHFDSVDSTNWTFGRYGHHWEYRNGHIRMVKKDPSVRCSNVSGLQRYNLMEWIKFERFAEAYL